MEETLSNTVSNETTSQVESEKDAVLATLDTLSTQTENIIKELKNINVELKNTKKRYLKTVKTFTKTKRRKHNVGSEEHKKEPSGFISPINLSTELTELLKLEPDTKLPRTVVTKKLIVLIKEHHLESTTNGRNFDLTDPSNAMAVKLKALFKIDKGDEVNYFNLQSFLKPNVIASVNKPLVVDESTTSPSEEVDVEIDGESDTNVLSSDSSKKKLRLKKKRSLV